MKPSLRLWPGVAAVALLWLVRFGTPVVSPESGMGVAVIGAMAVSVAVLVWWLAFSRAPWPRRLAAVGMLAAVLALTPRLGALHPSVAGGMMGLMFVIQSLPWVCLALVLWAAVSERLAVLAAMLLAVCGGFALLRTDGISGDGSSQLAWRWTETAEERLLLTMPKAPVAPAPVLPPPAAAVVVEPPVAAAVAAPAPVVVWPGFRGVQRDGVVRGVAVETDWAKSAPVRLWKRPVGPGWSSFALRDGLLYTQEQQGENEVVSCYRASTGEPVWTHSDTARFWESNAGAGPRSTPTLSIDGLVYTLGATGILNALDAGTGAVKWTRNAAGDTGAKLPGWGFAGSPLVVDDAVIVAVSGHLAAYDRTTGGAPRWQHPNAGTSYGSPQLLIIDGTPQVVLLSGQGATAVAPADGAEIWKHAWEGGAILQPALTADGGLLITTGGGMGGAGTRRLAVSHGQTGWTAEERWTSTGLKPYFNDIVVHNGHAYGFDGSILACIDLKDGQRKWKGGRYGHGQMVLLADQSLLLVLSEEGALALVSATPDGFKEIAKVPAIEGKTWNHPVIAGGVVYVRNSEEMAAFRLPVR